VEEMSCGRVDIYWCIVDGLYWMVERIYDSTKYIML